MTELDTLLKNAFESQGEQSQVNKFYACFFRTELYIPTQKEPAAAEEPFTPLFTTFEEHFFMVAFDTLKRLENWAGSHANDLHYVKLKGIDLLKGIGLKVYLGLNFGTDYYKEFAPDEIARLKNILSKISKEEK